jgi:hydroxyacylglutathione hydrolase
MKRINKEGPRVLGALPQPARLDADALGALLRRGEIVVDTRPTAAFAALHVPGTINIPRGGSFTTWAGWLLPYDRDAYLIVDDASADAAARDLALIGLDRVAGVLGTDAVRAWQASGQPTGTIAQRTPAEVAAMVARGEATVIDVRGRAEWEAGHLPDVPNIPVGYLGEHLDELPTDRPLVLHCQGGGRSSIAASVLQARGLTNVVNMSGGFGAWQQAGLPVTHDAEPTLATTAAAQP